MTDQPSAVLDPATIRTAIWDAVRTCTDPVYRGDPPLTPAPIIYAARTALQQRFPDLTGAVLGSAVHRELVAVLRDLGGLMEENRQLKDAARRYYRADGTYEVLGSAEEVVRRRIEAAGRMESLDWTDAVLAFQKKFGHHTGNHPSEPPSHIIHLRERLIAEEYQELIAAILSGNMAAIAKEAADLIYVSVGLLLAYGIDPRPVFMAVQKSNMSKSMDRREDGKTRKGPDYVPPDIAGVLARQPPDWAADGRGREAAAGTAEPAK